MGDGAMDRTDLNLAYIIITVDDSRKELKDALREKLSIPEITDVEFIDGRVPGANVEYIKKNNLIVHGGGFHNGDLGVWFSQMNCWKKIAETDYDGVIVLEDDAFVNQPSFDNAMPLVMKYLPDDYDFLALSVPADQKQDYFYDRVFDQWGNWKLASHMNRKIMTSQHYIGNPYVSTAYQGYSCVATMYSPKGARKLLDLVSTLGIYTPVDCFIFLEHFKKNLNGYAMAPNYDFIFGFTELGSIARNSGMFPND